MDFSKMKCYSLILLLGSISVSHMQDEKRSFKWKVVLLVQEKDKTIQDMINYQFTSVNRRYMVPAITLYLFCCTAGRIREVGSYITYTCSLKISELRTRVPYASIMRVCVCCHMHMNKGTYASVLPLLFITIPLLYVALCCTTRETVLSKSDSPQAHFKKKNQACSHH